MIIVLPVDIDAWADYCIEVCFVAGLELDLVDSVVVDLVVVRSYLHSMVADQDFVVDQPAEVVESLHYLKPVVLAEELGQMAVEARVLVHEMPANKKT